MSEQWENYYTKQQLKLIQKIELKNLKVFIDICNKLNLTYFLYGGTLLGVEKYKGFIPWDDDIDVALSRDSYEKFIKEAEKILPKEYFIQTPYNCSLSPYPYIKLRRKGTKFIEYSNRNINIETGIYIDIYPVDKIPDNEQLRKKQFKKVRKWILIYVCRQSPLYDKKTHGRFGFIKRFLKWIICNVTKIFSQSYCMDKINYYMKMYNNIETKRYAVLTSPNYNNIYEELYPLKDGIFENLQVKIPGDYKSHLKKRYGDYTVLPPENKRCGHRPYILDFGDNILEE